MVWQQEQRLSYETFLEKHAVIVFVFISAFVLLSIRLLYLQVIRGSFYKVISEQQRIQIIQERAPRGIIYDRFRNILVGNKTAFVALFYPFSQDSTPPNELLWKVNTIFPIKNLTTKITQGWRSGQVVRLAENLSRQEMFQLQEQRLMLPGISVVRESRRDYRAAEANSHLVGYLNEVSARELKTLKEEGYKLGDWTGRGGLEQRYDASLRGQDGGWQVEVDASGRQTRVVRHVPSKIGHNLVTTVDAELQQIAYEELQKTPTKRGAVIGIDPRSGAVRIFVSSPGFDPGLSFSKEFNRYLIDKELPLFNRAIQALYSPGSLFKVVTFIAGLAEGFIDPEKTFLCKGKFVFGNKIFHCWEKKGHDKVALIAALARSCNVYFYQIGLKIGEENLEKYAKKFRLNEPTHIDLLSEKQGLVPGRKWKKEKMETSWLPGDTINMAIGQGPLWNTPIQLAALFAAIANKGTFYQPYIVDEIVTSRGDVAHKTEIRKTAEIKISDAIWQMLHAGLREAVVSGTAQWCKFNTLPVAGKTGTAQNPHGEPHAWFAAFAPADNPELAFVVIVENGGGGGSIAAPIGRKILKTAFKEQTKDEW